MERQAFQQQHGILGQSIEMAEIIDVIQQVAPTDLTVLITGESGTGKEVIAKAIHNASLRAAKPMISVNAGAIPEGIIESELFGHEKGSFTGAGDTRKGYFELADGGTIFLDEIGELPLATQVKFLRVLENGEYMRVGSGTPRKVDIRVIAATNRDLEADVRQGKFRNDLFFRLRSINIRIPALRERREDIPLFIYEFARQVCEKNNLTFGGFSPEAIEMMKNYHWPGNVRELENFIERAVILTQGQDLLVSLAELKRTPSHTANSGTTTLEQAEREHILKSLRETNWTIGGPAGAAARLGMKRTTLQSKMQKLNISRPR